MLRRLPLLALLFLVNNVSAQTSYPMITHASPVALQRGTTTEVTVSSQMNLAGVYKALFEGTGISPVELPPLSAASSKAVVKSVKLKVKVEQDAAPGVRDFRLASTLGASSIGQVVIVDTPVIQEKGVNNTIEQANPIPVPCTVNGFIEAAEDVDYFKFHAEAGQTLTFEVLCARIQDRIHDLQKHADPMLTLFDASGRELAANDDFFFADPWLQYTFAKAGDYFIQVRDSKYDGDPRWVYALMVTAGPSVTHLFPMAANPGQTITVEPVGSAKLLSPKLTLTAPREEGLHTLSLDVKGQKTNQTAFIVSSLPQFIEQEPNDTPEKATRVTLPCGINGRIQQPRDLDHFIFKATKGKAIRLEVKARRFGSPLQSSLDSFLDVMTPDGKVLASNDDANGKDAGLVFTPPADGDYLVRIRDLNSKGSETAVYYLEADWAVPDFSLRCDPDKAMIGPGTSMAWFVQVTRNNGFTGAVKVVVKGLPKGVSVNPLTIPAAMTLGVLVLTADVNAPRDMVNVEIIGTGTAKGDDGKEVALVRKSIPRQEIYFPGGGRGLFDVSMQTVSVTEPSDIIKVEVTPARVKLKPGQEVKLDVTITRRPDYDKGVSLDIILRHLGSVFANPLPPGVTMEMGKSKTLLGNGTQGHIVLKAAANAAPIEDVPIAVMAHVSVNFVVKVGYSSPVILLTVEK
jgi:hypothetical protein